MSEEINGSTEEMANAIALAQAQERLRQESETFDQKVLQDSHWFRLRLAMGWVAVVLLPGIMIASTIVLVNHSDFARETVALAASTLFVDAAGLVFAVWRIVLGARSPDALAPVTSAPKIGGRPRRASNIGTTTPVRNRKRDSQAVAEDAKKRTAGGEQARSTSPSGGGTDRTGDQSGSEDLPGG